MSITIGITNHERVGESCCIRTFEEKILDPYNWEPDGQYSLVPALEHGYDVRKGDDRARLYRLWDELTSKGTDLWFNGEWCWLRDAKVVVDDASDASCNEPFEINMANVNALLVLESLGVPNPDYTGCVHPQVILKGAQQMAPAFCYARETREEHYPGGPHIVYCGLSGSSVRKRQERVIRIAEVAAELEEMVCWG